jgi:hypothetical protein
MKVAVNAPRGGRLGIYLGLTYKDTKAAWRLAGGHRASQRKILRMDLGALPPRASLHHKAISLAMRLLSYCFLSNSGGSNIDQGEPSSSSAG